MANEIYNTKKEFQKKKQAMRVELDDCKGDSAKFDTIFHRTKYIFEAMQVSTCIFVHLCVSGAFAISWM